MRAKLSRYVYQRHQGLFSPANSVRLITTGDEKCQQQEKNIATKSRSSGGSTKRWLHFKQDSEDTQANIRERNTAVTSYYNQHSIDVAGARPSVRLTPSTIMYSSKSADKDLDALRSAQYLHRELPIRLAHRVNGFRSLPFIVGCNPTILSVHELYIRAFHILNNFPEILTMEDVEKYDQVLRTLMEDHKDVVGRLAAGFREARKHIQDESIVAAFLDRTLTSRLGIRMLVTHHLHIGGKKEGHVGIVNLNMSLREVVARWADFVSDISDNKYGHTPQIKIYGHTSAVFPYIEMPLDYILPELLKNSVRATIENNPGQKGRNLPPIHVILASNDTDFIIKISDRGGGISHSKLENVMRYNFTTAEESTQALADTGVFANMMDTVNRTTSGPMHGFGFGLPTSSAYARYLGGTLQLQSMQGLGTDTYLRLKHLESRDHEMRI